MGTSQDMGAAGEYAVTSEMLYRGFNASIMSVDTGIDVVAVKDNKTYLVQVKTSKEYDNGYYHYDVRMKSLERFSSGNIFYIFVLRHENKNDFIILPSVEVEKKIKEKAIKTIEKHNKYRVMFKFYDDKIILGNKSHDVTYFLNNWDILK
jgi:hypothetical protein